jgi:hypothetical protein
MKAMLMNCVLNPSPLIRHVLALLALCTVVSLPAAHGAEATAELKNLSVTGGTSDGKARLVIEADLNGLPREQPRLIYATTLEHSIRVARDHLAHHMAATIEIIQGDPKEIPLVIGGDGEIRDVTGEGLLDWSVRQETNRVRTLVLRPRHSVPPLTRLAVTILADQPMTSISAEVESLTVTPDRPALFNGYVKVEPSPEFDVRVPHPDGLIPIENQFLPQSLRTPSTAEGAPALGFRFQGSGYSVPLALAWADPDTRRVVLRDFKLTGQMRDGTAAFTLEAMAHVQNPKGGRLPLLSGGAALTEIATQPDWRIVFQRGQFVLVTEKAGDFPIRLQFNAAVAQHDGWNSIDFRTAPSPLQPLVLEGLSAETQFQFATGARPERVGNAFLSCLPPSGLVNLTWKEARPESEGKLFYAAEMLSQISVSPGLMRQAALLDFKVMQGELNRVTLVVRGVGEVTRVQGDQVLAWSLEPVPNSTDRRLIVQLNQPQKDQFSLQVQLQTPLGAFPQAADLMQLRPDGVTRFAGYYRVVNEGAVRLEVTQSTGLSQISPEQFPESDRTKALLHATGAQQFAYRFASIDAGLRIQADQILPDLAVSEVLAYHLGESELSVDGELELDVREAPLREVQFRVPKGYALARLVASGLSDYFLTEQPNQPDAELRVLYSQPVTGRQVIQLRLERNQTLGATNWVLPRIEVARAKSTRGHLGISADAGFRVSSERTDGLTEIATAFFPRPRTGLQTAYRLSEANWQATLRIERLPQTVQADTLHLFSIGEGVAYGSSVMNYAISGAPVAAFRIELSAEYFNVEFTGKDIRNWQKTTNGYLVQLHTPVSGAYTLLATYERPFKPQGETLGFTGARPLEAQSEQGHTLVISAYQFQVQPVEVSTGLLPLETGEVPAEYRLLFDAPILAAYRYTARPFNLRLALSPLAQGDSLSQVVDRAALVTRISRAGQILTSARYFIKNRGNTHLRMTLPKGMQLWSALVNGASVVPVADANDNLIPLPQRGDPNAILTLDLKLASRSDNPNRIRVDAPALAAPVMLEEWRLEPDTGQRLVYRSGSLTPVRGLPDASGFAEWARTFKGPEAPRAWLELGAGLLLLALATVVCYWTTQKGVCRFSPRYCSGVALGALALSLAVVAFINLAQLIRSEGRIEVPPDITVLAPVQQANGALHVDVANVEVGLSGLEFLGMAWPGLLALAAWGYAFGTRQPGFRTPGWLLGWALLAWAALRTTHGAVGLLVITGSFLFVQVIIPALNRLAHLPKRSMAPVPPSSAAAAASSAFVLLAGGFLTLSSMRAVQSFGAEPRSDVVKVTDSVELITAAQVSAAQVSAKGLPLAESVTQEILVEEPYVGASVHIRWRALKGERLPILSEPAVLTSIDYPTNQLKLVQLPVDGKQQRQLLAEESGVFDVHLRYQTHVTKQDRESGFTLPTAHGLINQVRLTVVNADVDVLSTQAASVQRLAAGTNTAARLALSPVDDARISWIPRRRDVRREKPVFYGELSQLYVPSAGVIEGVHYVAIRPAQGELNELAFDVPANATITDVMDGTRVASSATNAKAQADSQGAPIVSLWRFDPDTRKLRVTLNPAQSKPFAILVRSQIPTGALPFEPSVGLLELANAAGQIGLLGIATGNEVQLDSVRAGGFSPVNIEDFPSWALQPFQGQINGLTLRRAYRYADPKAQASLKASLVQPDVRVETQETLSLGEDRNLLAVNATVTIARAGIFRLSFVLPATWEVESISGDAVSHWTEARADAGRVITLHLRGKTEGQQQFAISLVGPGAKPGANWGVPRFAVREAAKEQGTLLIVPEQGMRLQAGARDGLTQLDPQKSGVRQKGVLAFRMLQTPWKLALDIEQVEPWIQVTSLQHARVNEALVEVTANLQYQIENAGLKVLHVLLSTNADNVRFQGEQISDFRPLPGTSTNGVRQWEIKLHRRVLGTYLLQAVYQTLLPEQAREVRLRGVQAVEANLQRGFVTVQSTGRLQVRIDALPAALQPTEWQSIPKALQADLPAASANLTCRLIEPSFELPLQLDRRDAAKLLPARVNSLTMTSVVTDQGVMLTQARIELFPGDMRLLDFTLPANAHFWFAFVSQNGVWPWRDQDRILIPLEQQSRGDKPVPVEIFYSSQAGASGQRELDLRLLAPKFDLPLENVTWRVYLNEKWQLKAWAGALQLESNQIASGPTAVDLQSYLQNEAQVQRDKTKEAEQMMALGNTALEHGNPQQARRAFQAAFGLSQGDNAFNEDARVQLNNLKLQQALVGLNVRQAALANDSDSLAAKLREFRGRKEANYTQQDAKAIIDRNSGEENAAFMRLAQRLIQQQDAAVSSPAAIRASIPEQGRVLTFKRAVVVDTWSDLGIQLSARAVSAAASSIRFLILALTLLLFGLFAWAARLFRA